MGFRLPVLCGTVWSMICALFFLFACEPDFSNEKDVGAEAAVAVAGTLRNCLKVASGLKQSGDGDTASKHVLMCYEQHFVPMEAVLRAQNRRAALSLEYGFGLLAREMKQSRGDIGQKANQLADRVEAVLATLQTSESTATE